MEKVKLTDICDFQGGSQPPKEEWSFDEQEGYIRMLQIRDFTQGERVTPEYIKISNTTKMCEANDILIARYGASIGKILTGLAGAYNVAIMRTIPDTSRIKKLYLYYYLKSPYFQNAILNVGSRAAQAGFNKEDLSKLDIECPELIKQDKIIAVLEKLECIIEKRKIELSNLDDLIKARFVELFECGDHEIVKASDVCDFITKGTTPPTGEITEEYENGKIPFLKVYNLSFTGEMLFDENPQYILAETHNGKLARSKVYPNDVLMNIVGPPLGKFTLVTDEFEEWNINQAIAIFRAKERILPRFLLHALMQPKVLEPFIGQAVGIRQQNLSLEQCRNLQFPLPSLEEQKSFVEFAEQLDKSKVAVQKALDETQILFDSLMQKYFG